MSFQNLVTAAQEYFPKLKIKYKNHSWFMKLLSVVFFFSPGFMTRYTTTIGNTVYFPSKEFVQKHEVSSCIIVLHELVHLYDQKIMSKSLFLFTYLFPQILSPICLLLIFLLTWKIMLPLAIIFALPIPAVFRMYWEKRAYFSSFYVLQLLASKLKFNPHLKAQEHIFLRYFHDSSYYFMWPFKKAIRGQFDQALQLSKEGKRPYEDPVFDILDDLINKV